MDTVPVPRAPVPPAATQQPIAAIPMLCPQCHFPVTLGEYFCPNCGANLQKKPLSTTAFAQAWIYFFSLFLPVICYLAISKWPAFEYVRSEDPKARMIGAIAIGLMFLSTVVTFWLAAVWIGQAVQSAQSAIGGFGGGSLGGL